MFNGILEAWAGIFYLLQKVFLLFSERGKNEEKKRKWRINAWIVYAIGLPAWVIIFVLGKNWIAAFVESAGLPSMVLGIYLATRRIKKGTNRPLDLLALIAAIVGIGYSWHNYGGINTITQALEILMVTGYLAGSYLLAKKKSIGYLFYLLMNGSNCTLMFLTNRPWLVFQQVISIGFVVAAYITQKRQSRIS